MSSQKFGMMERVLAIVLSIVTIIGVLPIMSFAADETDYTLTVKDQNGTPVSGVTVLYTILVNEESEGSGNSETDEDGVATIDLSGVTLGGNQVELKYSIEEKTGYCAVSETTVEVTALNGKTDVTMTKKPTVAVDVTGGEEQVLWETQVPIQAETAISVAAETLHEVLLTGAASPEP